MPPRTYLIGESESLETFVSRHAQMRVELEARNPVCPIYGYPNPNMIPGWQAKLALNMLELPR